VAQAAARRRGAPGCSGRRCMTRTAMQRARLRSEPVALAPDVCVHNSWRTTPCNGPWRL
jgi:hypothetical protein